MTTDPRPYDRRDRTVFHKLHAGAIEVSAYARSIPEALAIEAAIKALPVSEAWGLPDVEPVAHAPELPPEVEARAYADTDDNTGDLRAWTADGSRD